MADEHITAAMIQNLDPTKRFGKMEPLWQSEDKSHPGLICSATYLPQSHQYEVSASHKGTTFTERCQALYEPRFGIDVGGLEQIYELATKLADRLALSDTI